MQSSPKNAEDSNTPQSVEDLNLSRCYSCNSTSIWKEIPVSKGFISKRWTMIWPPKAYSDHSPHPQMPDSLKATYNEATSIAHLSPRAATALLRQTLEGLLEMKLGREKVRPNDAIKELVRQKEISDKEQKIADFVRISGNSAVHPGLIENDEQKEILDTLLDFINILTEKLILEPEKIETLYQSLPASQLEAIKKRDA